jgi:hypothetical protein
MPLGERQAKVRDKPEVDRAEPQVKPAVCPPDLAGCVSATGIIIYVERVDPDGDGDAHFVLLDEEGISGPGITIVDVPAGLRPEPLPGPGEELSAAGLVQTGSFDQRQIESVDVSAGPRLDAPVP